MKKNLLTLALALIMSLTMSARNEAEVAGAKFGSSYEEALITLKTKFGEPSVKAENQLVFLNKSFEGFKADRVEVGFQTLRDASLLNQARFYFFCPNKAAAVTKMKALAKRMESNYTVSYDEENGGTAFYKGGCSPLGIGNLFTIFVSPYQGKWTCQLRYGKFLFK